MSTAYKGDARLIALDWGTSSLRGYLLGPEGVVLDQRGSDEGIMRISEGGFPATFTRLVGDWRQRHGALPALAAGMIGSTQGWVEASYLECPADVAACANGLTEVPGFGLWIISGVRQSLPSRADVMRGEETQILGALAQSNTDRGFFILPGTHSKWVTVASGRITGFSTFITGELFDVLSRYSILGRFASASDGGAAGEQTFLSAIDLVRRTGGATSLLFGTRAGVLTGDLAAELTLDHLSGLLIGDELVSALTELPADAPPTLIGNASLCGRYARALSRFGRQSNVMPNEVASAGIWQIAKAAGLVS